MAAHPTGTAPGVPVVAPFEGSIARVRFRSPTHAPDPEAVAALAVQADLLAARADLARSRGTAPPTVLILGDGHGDRIARGHDSATAHRLRTGRERALAAAAELRTQLDERGATDVPIVHRAVLDGQESVAPPRPFVGVTVHTMDRATVPFNDPMALHRVDVPRAVHLFASHARPALDQIGSWVGAARSTSRNGGPGTVVHVWTDGVGDGVADRITALGATVRTRDQLLDGLDPLDPSARDSRGLLDHPDARRAVDDVGRAAVRHAVLLHHGGVWVEPGVLPSGIDLRVDFPTLSVDGDTGVPVLPLLDPALGGAGRGADLLVAPPGTAFLHRLGRDATSPAQFADPDVFQERVRDFLERHPGLASGSLADEVARSRFRVPDEVAALWPTAQRRAAGPSEAAPVADVLRFSDVDPVVVRGVRDTILDRIGTGSDGLPPTPAQVDGLPALLQVLGSQPQSLRGAGRGFPMVGPEGPFVVRADLTPITTGASTPGPVSLGGSVFQPAPAMSAASSPGVARDQNAVYQLQVDALPGAGLLGVRPRLNQQTVDRGVLVDTVRVDRPTNGARSEPTEFPFRLTLRVQGAAGALTGATLTFLGRGNAYVLEVPGTTHGAPPQAVRTDGVTGSWAQISPLELRGTGRHHELVDRIAALLHHRLGPLDSPARQTLENFLSDEHMNGNTPRLSAGWVRSDPLYSVHGVHVGAVETRLVPVRARLTAAWEALVVANARFDSEVQSILRRLVSSEFEVSGGGRVPPLPVGGSGALSLQGRHTQVSEAQLRQWQMLRSVLRINAGSDVYDLVLRREVRVVHGAAATADPATVLHAHVDARVVIGRQHARTLGLPTTSTDPARPTGDRLPRYVLEARGAADAHLMGLGDVPARMSEDVLRILDGLGGRWAPLSPHRTWGRRIDERLIVERAVIDGLSEAGLSGRPNRMIGDGATLRVTAPRHGRDEQIEVRVTARWEDLRPTDVLDGAQLRTTVAARAAAQTKFLTTLRFGLGALFGARVNFGAVTGGLQGRIGAFWETQRGNLESVEAGTQLVGFSPRGLDVYAGRMVFAVTVTGYSTDTAVRRALLPGRWGDRVPQVRDYTPSGVILHETDVALLVPSDTARPDWVPDPPFPSARVLDPRPASALAGTLRILPDTQFLYVGTGGLPARQAEELLAGLGGETLTLAGSYGREAVRRMLLPETLSTDPRYRGPGVGVDNLIHNRRLTDLVGWAHSWFTLTSARLVWVTAEPRTVVVTGRAGTAAASQTEAVREFRASAGTMWRPRPSGSGSGEAGDGTGNVAVGVFARSGRAGGGMVQSFLERTRELSVPGGFVVRGTAVVDLAAGVRRRNALLRMLGLEPSEVAGRRRVEIPVEMRVGVEQARLWGLVPDLGPGSPGTALMEELRELLDPATGGVRPLDQQGIVGGLGDPVDPEPLITGLRALGVPDLAGIPMAGVEHRSAATLLGPGGRALLRTLLAVGVPVVSFRPGAFTMHPVMDMVRVLPGVGPPRVLEVRNDGTAYRDFIDVGTTVVNGRIHGVGTTVTVGPVAGTRSEGTGGGAGALMAGPAGTASRSTAGRVQQLDTLRTTWDIAATGPVALVEYPIELVRTDASGAVTHRHRTAVVLAQPVELLDGAQPGRLVRGVAGPAGGTTSVIAGVLGQDVVTVHDAVRARLGTLLPRLLASPSSTGAAPLAARFGSEILDGMIAVMLGPDGLALPRIEFPGHPGYHVDLVVKADWTGEWTVRSAQSMTSSTGVRGESQATAELTSTTGVQTGPELVATAQPGPEDFHTGTVDQARTMRDESTGTAVGPALTPPIHIAADPLWALQPHDRLYTVTISITRPLRAKEVVTVEVPGAPGTAGPVLVLPRSVAERFTGPQPEADRLRSEARNAAATAWQTAEKDLAALDHRRLRAGHILDLESDAGASATADLTRAADDARAEIERFTEARAAAVALRDEHMRTWFETLGPVEAADADAQPRSNAGPRSASPEPVVPPAPRTDP
ncbi:hypothetical protein HX744_26695 [Pseudonocardia sp. ICBG1122]|nr:hypothetical protein [Pseudonocardia pini]